MKKGKILAILFPSLVIVSAAIVTWEKPNEYDYEVTRVLDGDTVEISAPYLPKELGQTLKVRLLGIDTPEKGRLAKCELEKEKSLKAKEFVEKLLSESKSVKVILTGWDKYGGRVLGDIIIDGNSLSSILIRNNYAVEYHGKTKEKDWCVK